MMTETCPLSVRAPSAAGGSTGTAGEPCKKEKMDEPLVSVLVPVYNHAPWIRICIRSICMQRTDFPFEVLVADDASTDGSAEILREIEKEIPRETGQDKFYGTFRFLYRQNNLGPRRNGEDLYRRARGEFVIVLEGDDYWTYERKLQEQADFLRQHPECPGVAHRVQVVDAAGRPIPDWHLPGHGHRHLPGHGHAHLPVHAGYPECRHRNYTFRDWCFGILPGQTATLMFRKKLVWPCPFPVPDEYPGDQVKAFLLACHGEVVCFPWVWSAYRYHPETGSSFSGKSFFKTSFSGKSFFRTNSSGKSRSARGRVPWEVRRKFYREAGKYFGENGRIPENREKSPEGVERMEGGLFCLRVVADFMICLLGTVTK